MQRMTLRGGFSTLFAADSDGYDEGMQFLKSYWVAWIPTLMGMSCLFAIHDDPAATPVESAALYASIALAWAWYCRYGMAPFQDAII